MSGIHPLSLAAALLAMLAAGAPAQGAAGDAGTPSRMPSRADMLKIVNAGYVKPAGTQAECIGRLAFDVPGRIEWATGPRDGLDEPFRFRFSPNVYDRGDRISVGGIEVAVFDRVDDEARQRLLAAQPGNEAKDLRDDLARAMARLAALKKNKAPTEQKQFAISQEESRISSFRSALAGTENVQPLVDADGLYAYESVQTADRGKPPEAVLQAHLLRPPLAFLFKSVVPFRSDAEKLTHRKEFLRRLASFRLRKSGELPAEPGICIPYGFFADDGRTPATVKQTFRWTDAPSVLYAIDTGKVDPADLKATPVLAGVAARVGTFGTADEEPLKKHETQRIGPRQVPLGGLTAEQGGVALKIKNQGNAEVVETYSVFTGYAGWLGTDVLPYIMVDMRSLRRDQAPELTGNPPPFARSMGRLEKLLATVRLRSTTPAMPELR